MADRNGAVTRNYQYDAFGNQLNADTNDTNPFRYCGEYWDAETGNIYLRARYYDPSVGRFISEDPVRDGLNWYAYCGNNPVMFVDPSGLDYTWIREFGDVVWDESTASAALTIDGETHVYRVGSGSSVFIQDGKMYVDDQQLYKDFESGRAHSIIYAVNAAYNVNPNYPFYSSNCTNYVSQCLVSGGLATNRVWNVDKGITRRGWDYDPTVAWGTANGLYHYLVDDMGFSVVGYLTSNDSVTSVSNFVMPGDVIFWNMYNDPGQDNIERGFMNHAAIVTQVYDGEIYYCGNSEPRRNEHLSGKYIYGDVYIVRVNY